MANQRMKESWKKIKRRIRTTWSAVEFSDKELENGRKNYDRMVEIIHEKTGERRPKVLRKMDAVMGVAYRDRSLQHA